MFLFITKLKIKLYPPTPTIGGVGLIKNLDIMMYKNLKEIGSFIFVIGKTLDILTKVNFLEKLLNLMNGPPPEINLFNEKNNGLLIQN